MDYLYWLGFLLALRVKAVYLGCHGFVLRLAGVRVWIVLYVVSARHKEIFCWNVLQGGRQRKRITNSFSHFLLKVERVQ